MTLASIVLGRAAQQECRWRLSHRAAASPKENDTTNSTVHDDPLGC
jgi:hypothetical protein